MNPLLIALAQSFPSIETEHFRANRFDLQEDLLFIMLLLVMVVLRWFSSGHIRSCSCCHCHCLFVVLVLMLLCWTQIIRTSPFYFSSLCFHVHLHLEFAVFQLRSFTPGSGLIHVSIYRDPKKELFAMGPVQLGEPVKWSKPGLAKHISGGGYLLPKFMIISFFRHVSRFWSVSGQWNSNKEILVHTGMLPCLVRWWPQIM